MRPRLTAVLAVLVAAALASERFQLGVGPRPSVWLQQPAAPSLVSCAARCRQLGSCRLLVWESGSCRLADGDSTSAATEGPEIALYRRADTLVSVSGITSSRQLPSCRQRAAQLTSDGAAGCCSQTDGRGPTPSWNRSEASAAATSTASTAARRGRMAGQRGCGFDR
ncbi:hypothetical protein FJT64_000191 [Amphibalanus amphitrite]|uniref:Apple domain-containing protein n=1 Tax=Amphibalanus amphitrite TaxID=1232801 RepID=A0A6A4X486_AMPAM|nr:hypothetical protein FJT64_000191 [Amphibalanus amphitrite]